MAKHNVKCLYCGEIFDTNDPNIKWVKPNATRYAHEECLKKKEDKIPQEEKDLKALKDYINDLYGDKCSWALVQKQIKKFHKENGYSYTGIMSTLKYFYEIKHGNIDESRGGIGIVPFIWDEAYKYYYNIYMAQQKSQKIVAKGEVREVSIKSPRVFMRQPQLWFEGEEE